MTLVDDYDLQAGTQLVIGIGGAYFVIMSASAAVDAELRRNRSRIVRAVGVEEGTRFGPIAGGFHEIALTSASAQTVKIAISDDPVEVQRLSGTVTTREITPSKAVPLADVACLAATAQKIADANADRVYCTVYNNTGGLMRIGTVTDKPAAAAGAIIPAGVGLDVHCTDELWAYTVNAGNVSLTDFRK